MKVHLQPIDSIRPYDRNPRKNDSAVKAVAESIKRYGFRQPIVVDKEGTIIVGHTRWKAAKELGLAEVPVHVADMTEKQAREYRIADNKTNELASWDMPALKVEMEDLDLGWIRPEDAPETDPADVPPDQDVPADLVEMLSRHDEVRVAFSGGKDSLAALHWSTTAASKAGKPLRAMYVETGGELPCVTAHVVRVCSALDIELDVLHPPNGRHIYRDYAQNRKFPDPIHKECIQKYINDATDAATRDVDAVLVRGGRSDQRAQGAAKSKLEAYKEYTRASGQVVRLLNPYYRTSKAAYSELLKALQPLMWTGYQEGFERTACWFCPFQGSAQFEALRTAYPRLWDLMRQHVEEWSFKKYKGDGNWPRLKRYWGKLAAK